MNCPLCDGASKPAFEAKGFVLRDCLECGHRFAEIAADEAHVRRVYDASYFSGGGAGYADYVADGELLKDRGRMYAMKLETFTNRQGRLLDVGAAAGFIMQGFAEKGWSAVGLEPSAEMARYGRERFGLDIRCGSLEGFETGERFDLVSMIQVAAHFYDPRAAFQKAADLLGEEGLLLVETWNRESISARLFGAAWHEYSPPSVLHWFSERGLTAFLRRFCFEQVARGRPSKKISGAHAKSLLEYRLGQSFLLRLIPDKLNVPYPAEDLFWALYRKTDR